MSTKLQELRRQIEALQAEAEDLARKEKAGVIQEIRSKIDMYGITARELGLHVETGRPKGVIRYRKGDQAWSGRGRKPGWVIQHLESGGKIEDLAV